MRDSCKHLKSLGIPFEKLDGRALNDRFPGLSLERLDPPRRPDDEMFGELSGETISSIIWAPDAGYVNDPLLAAQNIYQAGKREGIDFLFNMTVSELFSSENRMTGVGLSDGRSIKAHVVVNAAGPFSSKLNVAAGISDDMKFEGRPLRIEVCHLPCPEGLTKVSDEPFVVLDMDGGTYLRSDNKDSLFVGGTEPECDPLEWVEDPEQFDKNPSDQWTAQAYRAGLRVPTLQIPGQARGVTDLYDATPDWTPIYDKSSLKGYYIAAGTSGNQFKNGPVVGELMAGLIHYCESGHDHDNKPYHHVCKRTGNTINTAAFSRLREINDSISNVMGVIRLP